MKRKIEEHELIRRFNEFFENKAAAVFFPVEEPPKPITININAIIGTLVVAGADVNTDAICAKVEHALNEVVESARERLTDCQLNVHDSTIEDYGASRSQREFIQSL